MLKLRFILIALTCGLGCFAAPSAPSAQQPSQDWVQLNGFDVHPTRLLVRFKEGATKATQGTTFKGLGMTVRREYAIVPGLAALDAEPGGYVAATATKQERTDALQARIDALMATGQYEFVEPDYVVTADLQPTDANYLNGTLWGLHNTGIQGGLVGADIDAEHAWDITTGSTNVIVAVIDTGVRYTHQELASQMWHNPGESGGGKESNGIDDDNDGYIDDVFGINAINNSGNPLDDNNHGTHVSGTIGAQANGGGPHVGVAWNVQIMGCKFLAAAGFGFTDDAVECLNFAVLKGAKISNNSWGGGGFSQALFDALSAARGSNHLFIAAAGNSGQNIDQSPAYPASYNLDNIVSVAALDRADRLASFSNYGLTNVDLGAPGVSIFSSIATSDSSYALFDGTSMATPHVTGVAALARAKFPGESYLQTRDRLLLTVVTNTAMSGRSITGGRVNAYKALLASPDNILEMSVTPPSGEELLKGSTNAIFVRVSDFFAVTNATVTGTVTPGGSTLKFLNNGVSPDAVTNDGIYTTNFMAPNIAGVSNVTLTIIATATGKTGATNSVTYVLVPPPPNDFFTNATKSPAAGGLFTGRNKFATRESGEPSHAGTAGTRSLWWNWSPSVSGPVLLDTAGSTFDTVLAAYTGNNVSTLTNIASVDDVVTPSGVRLQGYVTFDVIAGTTYRIAVAGYDSTQFGTIRLRIEPNGTPDTNAPLVFITSPAGGLVSPTNKLLISGFATDPTPNASGISEVQVQVNGLTPAQTAIGSTNWSATILLNPGANTIAARAYDFAGNLSGASTINLTYTVPPPGNDHFVNAAPIAGDSGTAVTNTTLATKEFGEPYHAGNIGGKSVWWKFTPPSDGVLFLSTTNSSFDTLLGLYAGTAVGSLTTNASNDDAPGGGTFSELSQAVSGGQTYRIAVDGYAGASGTVQLTYSFTPATLFTLALTNTTGGSVTPSTTLVASNSTVTITALPDLNFGFSGWTGSLTTSTNPLTVIVRSNMTLTGSFSLLSHTDDFETGDFKKLAWTQGGAAWIIESTNVSSGSFAARSGVIGNNQTSSLKLNVEFQAGIGAFDLSVSSESGWDTLEFLMDGVVVQEWSGEAAWIKYSFPITAGPHALEWRYSKDVDTFVGMDAAFIDNVDLPLSTGAMVVAPAHLALRIQGPGTFILDLTGTANQTYVLQSSTNLTSWQSISTNNVGVGGVTNIPVSSSGPTSYYRAFAQTP